MVNKIRTKTMLTAAAAVLSVALIAGIVTAKTKSIKYLPQDYSMEMLKQDYKKNPIELSGVDCATAPQAQAYFNCQACTTLRQLLCKDCCFLGAPANGQLRCADGDPAYCDTRPGLPFDTDDNACPAAQCTETSCQNQQPPVADCPDAQHEQYQYLGCPKTTEPAPQWGSDCIGDEDTSWSCSNGALDARPACVPRVDFRLPSGSPLQACGTLPPYDLIDGQPEELYKHKDTPMGPWHFPEDSRCDNNWAKCFEYAVNPDYFACVKTCKDTAKAREDCAAQQKCCTDAVCPDETPSGIVNCPHRSDPADPMQSCDKRIAKQCDTIYATAPCNVIIKKYNEWLLSGDAPDCFQPVDPSQQFKYRFVARSNEKITITWQVLCNAVKKGNPDESDRMFYTMVRVRDEDGGQPAHNSIIHQRSFQNKFFISAATTIPAGYLQAGKAYIAEIYYYIPLLQNEELQMNVEYLQLILHRSRE
jgi:hypothetical protein